MQTFKNAVISFVSLILCVAILFAASFFYSDKLSVVLNKKQCIIPDNTNFVICGASQSEMTFIPNEIDRQLDGVNSYNFSIQSMRLRGRLEVLKNMISQNRNIKTVVLELSYDSFERDEGIISSGDITLKGFYKAQLSEEYKLRYTYNRLLVRYEIENIKSFFTERSLSDSCKPTAEDMQKTVLDFGREYKGKNRGFVAFEPVDVKIPENRVEELYCSEKYESIIQDENLKIVNNIIDLCKDNGIELIITVVPLSDAFIWKQTSMDDFHNFLFRLAKARDCKIYDFNLLKNRYSIFNDTDSFYNETHMSYSGAKVFTEEFCKIMTKAGADEDVSDLFYSSYDEMKADSPYRQYKN